MDDMTHAEQIQRLENYGHALRAHWKAYPSRETQLRLNNFMGSKRVSRMLWISWVERMAREGKVDWCVEVVMLAVERKLGIIE